MRRNGARAVPYGVYAPTVPLQLKIAYWLTDLPLSRGLRRRAPKVVERLTGEPQDDVFVNDVMQRGIELEPEALVNRFGELTRGSVEEREAVAKPARKDPAVKQLWWLPGEAPAAPRDRAARSGPPPPDRPSPCPGGSQPHTGAGFPSPDTRGCSFDSLVGPGPRREARGSHAVMLAPASRVTTRTTARMISPRSGAG